jgi:hypothetical protein
MYFIPKLVKAKASIKTIMMTYLNEHFMSSFIVDLHSPHDLTQSNWAFCSKVVNFILLNFKTSLKITCLKDFSHCFTFKFANWVTFLSFKMRIIVDFLLSL